jgi:hypothetical protein
MWGKKTGNSKTRRRESIIEVNFKEMGRDNVDWINLAQDRFQ